MADGKKVLEIIKAVGLKMEAERGYLAELNQPIGDSGHGVNMTWGFTVAEEKLPDLEGKDIGTILETVGMTLVPTVGGTSDPLYGSAYMKADMALAGKDGMDMGDFLSMMDTTVQAVEQRGKATVEEATMLDAIVPSLEAMKDVAAEGESAGKVLETGVRAAWVGAEYTKDLVVTKGRTNYVGERGLRRQDPGATSYSYILEAIAGLV